MVTGINTMTMISILMVQASYAGDAGREKCRCKAPKRSFDDWELVVV